MYYLIKPAVALHFKEKYDLRKQFLSLEKEGKDGQVHRQLNPLLI